MNKVKFYLMTLIMGAMSLSVVNAARVPLTYDDPTDPFQNPHRNPIPDFVKNLSNIFSLL